VLVVILIIFALAGAALLALAFENIATLTIVVHVKVFGWHAPAFPLGVLVLLAFLLDALLLYIVSVLSAWKDRRQLSHEFLHIFKIQINRGEANICHFVVPPQTIHDQLTEFAGFTLALRRFDYETFRLVHDLL